MATKKGTKRTKGTAKRGTGINQYKPGDRIEWDHFRMDGTVVRRTGMVCDAAPKVYANECPTRASLTVAWWVIPDEKLPTDVYHCIAVGKAHTYTTAHGRYIDGIGTGQWVQKGQLYSSDYVGSPTGWLTNRAAVTAHKTREENAKRARANQGDARPGEVRQAV